MTEFNSFDGTKIAYERDGDGFAVLLVHGFATDGYINWIRPGVVDALVGAGRSAVTAHPTSRTIRPPTPATRWFVTCGD